MRCYQDLAGFDREGVNILPDPPTHAKAAFAWSPCGRERDCIFLHYDLWLKSGHRAVCTSTLTGNPTVYFNIPGEASQHDAALRNMSTRLRRRKPPPSLSSSPPSSLTPSPKLPSTHMQPLCHNIGRRAVCTKRCTRRAVNSHASNQSDALGP